MVREHGENKTAGKTNGKGDSALDGGEAKAVPIADANAKKREKQIAHRELEAFRRHKPTLDSAHEDRLKAMAALNLDSQPRYALFYPQRLSLLTDGPLICSARQTIRFLKDQRQRQLQLLRQ